RRRLGIALLSAADRARLVHVGIRLLYLAASARAEGRLRDDRVRDARGRSRPDDRGADRLQPPPAQPGPLLGALALRARLSDRVRLADRLQRLRLAACKRADRAGLDLRLRQPGDRDRTLSNRPRRVDHLADRRWG